MPAKFLEKYPIKPYPINTETHFYLLSGALPINSIN